MLVTLILGNDEVMVMGKTVSEAIEYLKRLEQKNAELVDRSL